MANRGEDQMKLSRRYFLLLLLPLLGDLAGCAGSVAFTSAARQGETISLAVGYQNIARQNLTVTITPSLGSPVTYLPNDPKVRAVVNLYPNPSSGLVVGTQTAQNLGNSDSALGTTISNQITSGNQEWWQTIILLDLPAPFPTGPATISIVDSAGAVINPVGIEVLPGTSTTSLFNNVYLPPAAGGSVFNFIAAYPYALKSLEQTPRYAVTFTGATIPHSIGVQFTHTPTVGKTWVVNPRGDIKNVTWTDDGSTITVMVTPTGGQTLTQMIDFKFYIAGGITALTQVPSSLKAYDINGNLIAGVTAAVQ